MKPVCYRCNLAYSLLLVKIRQNIPKKSCVMYQCVAFRTKIIMLLHPVVQQWLLLLLLLQYMYIR